MRKNPKNPRVLPGDFFDSFFLCTSVFCIDIAFCFCYTEYIKWSECKYFFGLCVCQTPRLQKNPSGRYNKSAFCAYISTKGDIMKSLKTLFEYQKFKPHAGLQKKIDAVSAKYLSGGVELADEELNVAAAGEPQPVKPFQENQDADKK